MQSKTHMKRIAPCLILMLSGSFTAAQAVEPALTKQEIAHLFTVLEASTCQFQRNGTWHSAKDATTHLQTKYKYLQDKDLVPSTEMFIERAATESSFSGKAYQIKCGDSVTQSSASWFFAALYKYRNPKKGK
jgi:Family of unknown function (DUF5329)